MRNIPSVVIVGCPVCRAPVYVQLFSRESNTGEGCEECGHQWTDDQIEAITERARGQAEHDYD